MSVAAGGQPGAPAAVRRDPGALLAAGAPLLAALVAFALARSVLLPGQGFWDTGEFQVVPPLLGTAHSTGYPSYVILGWLASLALTPVGEPALRMNLLAALLLAAACGLTALLVGRLTGRAIIGLAAGLLLALTPLAWRMGAFADPHTLHLALCAALLIVLVGWEERRRAGAAGADRWLVGAAALYGVMLGNHTLTVLLAPGIALFVLAVEPSIVRRPGFIARCAAALLATTIALYLQLPIRAAMGAPLVYGHPDTWEGFWYVVLGRQFLGEVDPFGDLGRKLGDLVELAWQELGILAAAVPAAFVVVAIRRPRFAFLTATWLGVTCWFAASYTNADIERYYLVPALVVVAWLGIAAGLVADAARGSGGGTAAQAAGGHGTAGSTTAVTADRAGVPGSNLSGAATGGGAAAAVAAIALAVALVLPAALAAPANAARIDLGDDTAAADWSRWALAAVDSDAVIVSWWGYSTPLWYRTLLLGERPDVWVVDDRDRLDEDLGSVEDVIRANLRVRPVYLVRLPDETAELAATWQLVELPDPIGIQSLYQVVAPRSPAAGPMPPNADAVSSRLRPATIAP